jgi:hypothetical protein
MQDLFHANGINRNEQLQEPVFATPHIASVVVTCRSDITSESRKKKTSYLGLCETGLNPGFIVDKSIKILVATF